MASAPGSIVTARQRTVSMTGAGAYSIIDPTPVGEPTRLWVTRRIGYRNISSTSITVLGRVTIGGNPTTYDNIYDTGGGFQPDPVYTGIIWVPFNAPGYIDLGAGGLVARVATAATGTAHSVSIIVVGHYL